MPRGDAPEPSAPAARFAESPPGRAAGRGRGIRGSGRAAGRGLRGSGSGPEETAGTAARPAVIAGVWRRCGAPRSVSGGGGVRARLPWSCREVPEAAVLSCLRGGCAFSHFRVKVRAAATGPAAARRTTRCAERRAGPGRPPAAPSGAASGLEAAGAAGRAPRGAAGPRRPRSSRSAASGPELHGRQRRAGMRMRPKRSASLFLSRGVVPVPAPCVS